MIWSLRSLRWSYCAFIAYASAVAIYHPGLDGHTGLAIRVLAAVEVFAALIFATGLFDLVACATLLLLFLIVGLIAIAHGEAPLRFLYYAATAVLVTQAERSYCRPAGRRSP
jgi:hypothetical protein